MHTNITFLESALTTNAPIDPLLSATRELARIKNIYQ